jgi:hypothetical protein
MRLFETLVVATAAFTCGADSNGYAPRPSPAPLPGGTVGLVSFGIAELAPSELPAMPALHVRFTVANERDAVPWQLDLRDLKLELSERVFTAPLFANSDVLGMPLLSIRRDERRMFDVYFALPPTVNDDTALETFRIHWAVTTSEGRRTAVVAFARIEMRARAYADARGAGWGPRWWCDPSHPWPLFHRRPGPIKHRAPTSVTVRRAPAGQPVAPR